MFKKAKKNAIVILVICVGFVSSLLAEEQKQKENTEKTSKIVLSLDDCIKKAIENFPSIKIAKDETEYYRAKLSEAKLAKILPKFEFTNIWGPVPDVEGTVLTDESEFGFEWSDLTTDLGFFTRIEISALQPLFTFGKLKNIERAASEGVKAAIKNEQQIKNDLILKIKKLYYGILIGEELARLIDDSQEKLKQAEEKIEELIKRESDRVTPLDRLKVEIFRNDLSKREVYADSRIKTAKSTIKVLIGIEKSDEIELKPVDRDPSNFVIATLDYYIEKAIKKRPDLARLESAVKVRESLLAIEKAKFFPDFFLGAQFKYGWAPGRTNIKNPFVNDDFNLLYGGIAVGLKQNLNFFSTNAKYRQKKLEYSKILKQKELALLGVKLQVEETYNKLFEAQKKFDICKKDIKTARSWLTQAVQQFEDGLGDIGAKDLTESFLAYAKAKVEYYQTLYDFDEAMAELSEQVNEELQL